MKHYKSHKEVLSQRLRKQKRQEHYLDQCANYTFEDDLVCLPVHVWLIIGESAIRLKPNERITIMQNLHVDETATVSLQAVDVFGNIVSDAVFQNVQFDNSDETVAKSTVGPDGTTVTLDPLGNAVGKETNLTVTASINGVTFTASDTFTVVAGKVAGIQLITTFNPKSTAPQPAPAP